MLTGVTVRAAHRLAVAPTRTRSGSRVSALFPSMLLSLVLLPLVLLGAGCTPAPVTPRSSASSSAGDGPGGGSAPTSTPPVVDVDGLLRWYAPPQVPGIYLLGARYELRPQRGVPDTMLVLRRADQRVVLVQPPPGPGYRQTFAGLWTDVAVFGYEPADHRRPSRATLVNLASGVTTTVDAVPGAPPMSASTAVGAVVDGRYWYLATNVNAELDCVAEVALDTLTARTVECGRFGEWVKELRPADHGASWLLYHGSSEVACREGRAVRTGPTGAVTAASGVGPADACDTVDAVTAGGAEVWGSGSGARLSARPGRTTVDLGPAGRGSLFGCAGWAYWSPDTTRRELRRWQPGRSIQRVWSGSGASITSLGCADDILTVLSANGPRLGLATLA